MFTAFVWGLPSRDLRRALHAAPPHSLRRSRTTLPTSRTEERGLLSYFQGRARLTGARCGRSSGLLQQGSGPARAHVPFPINS